MRKSACAPRTRFSSVFAGPASAAYFVSWVRQSLVDQVGPQRAFEGNLRVRTTLDSDLQDKAVKPLADVHVRRAISYAIDRKSMVKSILFGYGKPANSFMPPQVPYYDPESPGLQFNVAQAKKEMAASKYPKGFKVEMLLGSGVATEKASDRCSARNTFVSWA